MKQAMRITLCLALVLSLLLCFTACALFDAGTYKLTGMKAMGMTMELEDIKNFMGASDEDLNMYVELRIDGTGTMVALGETVEMGWGDGQMWPLDDPDDKVNYTIEDGVLTLSMDGVEMIFKK